MDPQTVAENRKSFERLQKVVSQLDDSTILRQMPGGWTVGALLAHLAFWDYRALILIERWKNEGISASPLDVDCINDAARPLCLAIPPNAFRRLVIEAAEAIDRALLDASSELISQIENSGGLLRLSRANHRNEHLDQIEPLL